MQSTSHGLAWREGRASLTPATAEADDPDALAIAIAAALTHAAPALPAEPLALAIAGQALMAAEGRIAGRLDDDAFAEDLAALEAGLRRLATRASPGDPHALLRAVGPMLRQALAARLDRAGHDLPPRPRR